MSILKDLASTVGYYVSEILSHGKVTDPTADFPSLVEEMQSGEAELSAFLQNLTGYVYTYAYRAVSDRCRDLEQRVEQRLRTYRFLKGHAYHSLQAQFDSFLAAQRGFTEKIQQHNSRILDQKTREVYALIGNVEGQALDKQQLACIALDARNHLVLAGAGTGKTTTILGKVKYLLQSSQVLPEELLILSFTNAAASEMKARLLKETSQKIYVATFHKLGLDIIRRAEGIAPKVSQQDVRSFSLEDIQRLASSRSYQLLLLQFFLYHRVQARSEFSFENVSEYQDYLETNPPTTILEEKVKSYGEMMIANFLTQHSVRYQYEAAYPVDTRTADYGQYHPDFFLPDYNVYIEYFGVSRDGSVPLWFSEKGKLSPAEAYRASMDWKRSLHQQHGTTMLECYAYENMEGTLLEHLEERLKNAGVKLKALPLNDVIERSGANEKNVLSTLADTVSTAITLCRNKRMHPSDLEEICRRTMPDQLAIAALVKPVFIDYETYLAQNGLVDFTDMLNRAEDLVTSGKFVHKFRYVIVDEYQDVSSAQYRLLQALRRQADYSLFCVGDDWQSIYRFAGSDIGYILYFDRYWGDSQISRIETTYRFSQGLIDVSSRFIMRNPNQIKKYIRSGNNTEQLVLGRVHGYTEETAIRFLADKLETLPQNATVFLIGRYQFDIDLLRKCGTFSLQYDNQANTNRVLLQNRPDLSITYYTAHRSKGLQADYVFIINNRGSYMGFPSKVQNPPLIELLLEQADRFPDAEERRLFYVALTRARKRAYLVTAGRSISSFANELIAQYGEEMKREAWSCPLCGGQLKKVVGPYGTFYGCSNYRTTGCKYTRRSYQVKNSQQD